MNVTQADLDYLAEVARDLPPLLTLPTLLLV